MIKPYGLFAPRTSSESDHGRPDPPSRRRFPHSYAADTTVFPTKTSRNMLILGIVLICFAPYVLNEYMLACDPRSASSASQPGLKHRGGLHGQISIGHAAFFGFGAFTSAYLSSKLHVRCSSPSRSPARSRRWSG